MTNSSKKTVDELSFPEDICYHREHTWVRPEVNIVKVGISDYAQNQLGDIIFFELPSVGEKFAQDQSFGTVESVKVVSTLYMPVSGTVMEVNGELDINPEIANQDPYDAGWIITIKPDDVKIDNLLTCQEYIRFLKDVE